MVTGDEGSVGAQRVRAEADRIEEATAEAERRLLLLVWYGPGAGEARARAAARRRRTAWLADGLRRAAAELEAASPEGSRS